MAKVLKKKKKSPSKSKPAAKKISKKKAPARKSPLRTAKARKAAPSAASKARTSVKPRRVAEPSIKPIAAAPAPAAVSAERTPTPPPIEPPAPTRAPVRKIIGTDRTITVVPPRPAETRSDDQGTAAAPLPASVNSIPELRIAEAPVRALAPAPEPTYDWDSVPEYVPAQVRFSIKNAIKECEAASAWPLPLAKFFASLPSEICGLQFAMMLMNLSQTAEEIAAVCGKPVDKIAAMIETAQSNLQEKFSTKCGEIYRRWRLQLSGRGADSAELIAHHSISQVDKDWQITVANIILKAMGGEHFGNGDMPHPNRWWLNPARAQQAGS